MTLPIGLGIGTLVFRGLNGTEVVLAVVVLVALVVDPAAVAAIGAYGTAGVVLPAELLVVRPRPTRRSDAVLAGADAPRSYAHHAYIALESSHSPAAASSCCRPEPVRRARRRVLRPA